MQDTKRGKTNTLRRQDGVSFPVSFIPLSPSPPLCPRSRTAPFRYWVAQSFVPLFFHAKDSPLSTLICIVEYNQNRSMFLFPFS
jgi:hypothetical protein